MNALLYVSSVLFGGLGFQDDFFLEWLVYFFIGVNIICWRMPGGAFMEASSICSLRLAIVKDNNYCFVYIR